VICSAIRPRRKMLIETTKRSSGMFVKRWEVMMR
jgi:hypothetical protein